MPAKTKKELRQERLLQIIESGGFSTIEALAAQLDVTNQTVRRDTAELMEQGRVRRYHGGVAPGVRTDDLAYRQRRGYNLQAKERIARAVAAAIPDHSSIFLEVGGTTEAIAQALCRHSGLHIVTHSLRCAAILSERTDFRIALPAGYVRNGDGAIFGDDVAAFVSGFRYDVAVLSPSGITGDGMMTVETLAEARILQAALGSASRRILAADRTKFGLAAPVTMDSLASIQTLITDTLPDAALSSLLRRSGVEVTVGK